MVLLRLGANGNGWPLYTRGEVYKKIRFTGQARLENFYRKCDVYNNNIIIII